MWRSYSNSGLLPHLPLGAGRAIGAEDKDWCLARMGGWSLGDTVGWEGRTPTSIHSTYQVLDSVLSTLQRRRVEPRGQGRLKVNCKGWLGVCYLHTCAGAHIQAHAELRD